jgi:hypothetical protein
MPWNRAPVLIRQETRLGLKTCPDLVRKDKNIWPLPEAEISFAAQKISNLVMTLR